MSAAATTTTTTTTHTTTSATTATDEGRPALAEVYVEWVSDSLVDLSVPLHDVRDALLAIGRREDARGVEIECVLRHDVLASVNVFRRRRPGSNVGVLLASTRVDFLGQRRHNNPFVAQAGSAERIDFIARMRALEHRVDNFSMMYPAV